MQAFLTMIDRVIQYYTHKHTYRLPSSSLYGNKNRHTVHDRAEEQGDSMEPEH